MTGINCLIGDPKLQVIDIINKLSTARMEYQASNGSVLNKFVVPYFIDRLDLRNISHSIALVGSRGSGKSTYIQYFSQSTRFDKLCSSIDKNEFDCILLYWKPDIAYCQGLKTNWLNEHALRFFSLHASLSLMKELCCLITNVNYHFPDLIKAMDSNKNFWNRVSKVVKQDINSILELDQWVEDYNYELSTRLNPVDTDGLLSIDPNSMLKYLIDALRSDYSKFEETTFKVFIDEFELLTTDQQKLINNYRKESSISINWNVAYKINARPCKETNSDQWLQSPDDYIEFNIDELIRSDYKIFAAEIFILTLQNSGLECNIENLSPYFLGDRSNIKFRKTKNYQNTVLRVTNNILPFPSIKELSRICIEYNSVKNILNSIIEQWDLNPEVFNLIYDNPSLAITIIGTHKQKSFDENLWKEYLGELPSKETVNKINDKINTYEFSTLLSLNLQHTAVNVPVYAGFERFITMTTPNIRHFKEICLNALRYSEDIDEEVNYIHVEDIKSISASGMHLGALSTSTNLVKEVLSYPPYGNKFYKMVNRIGEIFKISQKSSYQSEPERVIFTFPYDYAGSDEDLESFIASALSWRVIIEDDSKRIRDDNQITNKEFQLNPIYSPRFGISYRKKRGITFSVDEFKIIISGSTEDFEIIKKLYQEKWKLVDSIGKQGLLL